MDVVAIVYGFNLTCGNVKDFGADNFVFARRKKTTSASSIIFATNRVFCYFHAVLFYVNVTWIITLVII